MIENPFPGPQPYRAADRDRFQGREDLAYALEGCILANRCVTVHGPSGAGKSSLVQAAIIPSLVEAHEIRVVRVDGWPDGEDPGRWLANAMYTDLGFGSLPDGIPPEEAVLAAARRAARRSPRILLVYLDQIEQLLYAGRSADRTGTLFECVSQLVELPLRNLRVLLSLREDYLGRFRDRLRDQRRILDHGFRVGPLTVAELTAAVCQAAATGRPPQTWSLDEIRPLMLQVRVPGQTAGDEAEAQAAYAQIVCRALFQRRARGAQASAGEEVFEAEPILRGYLETTLEELGELRPVAQRLLEDHLITSDGGRTLRTEAELLRILPAEQLMPCLGALERAAILHAEEHQGSRYFELGHDWLARRVHEQRSQREREEEQRRRDEEQQAALLRAREEAEATLAKERAKRRTLLFIALASLTVAACAGALGLWALRQKREAEAARFVADRRKELAIKEQIEAHDARIIAGFRELEARKQPAWALKLLPEVRRPAERRGWIEIASKALSENALRVSLRGHEGSLSAAVFSPDPEGKRVLTASTDRTARIWSADGKGRPVVLAGHERPITSAAWSPDGKRVLTASEDGTARIWSADGVSPPVVLTASEQPLTTAAWSPDGRRVVTASRDGIARVHAADGSGEVQELRGHKGPLTAAAFLPPGARDQAQIGLGSSSGPPSGAPLTTTSAGSARVLTASEDGTARVWTLDPAVRFVELEDEDESSIVFATVSPDGKRIVTASRDKTARVWSADGKGKVTILAHEGLVYHAAVSPDGRLVATASADGTARIWSLDGSAGPLILKHPKPVSHVAFRPDGKYIATVATDRTVRVWSVDDGDAPDLELNGHEAPIRSAQWSLDGAWIVTAAADVSERSPDRTARVWSAALLQALPRGLRRAGVFHSVFLSEDGKHAVAAYDDNRVRVFHGGDEEPVVLAGPASASDRPPDPKQWIAYAALSPDGARVITASFDGLARIRRADGTGDPIVLQGHAAPVRFAAWSPDGEQVVTASQDRTARVWDADGTPKAVLQHEDWLTSAAWSPDGKRVVTTSLDRTARIWSAAGGAPIVLKGHTGDVLTAAWHPGGTHVVTASEDHTARIWKADGSGAPIVLKGHRAPVLLAMFSPDGERVVTSSTDRAVRVWTAGGEPSVVLESQAQILGMRFLDDGSARKIVSVAADGSVQSWLIDIDALMERLRRAHADCLPSSMRRLYLGEEDAAVAQQRYDECVASLDHPSPPDRGEPATTPPARPDGIDPAAPDAPPGRLLSPGEVRVAVVVLPGDAEVAVGDAPVRRRDGVIELVGKANDRLRLRVFLGPLSTEQEVTLGAEGATPPLIEHRAILARKPAGAAAARPGAPGPAGSPAPAPADPLLPDSFE